MKTLAMDTTHKYLVIGLFEDDKIVASVSEKAWKKQSERFFPALIDCMNQVNWCADDLKQVVITEGPGSYTGERIAMTIAKVLCTTKKIPLYTISTFQLYAGNKDCTVIMDARSNRAYVGECIQGQLVNEHILTLDELQGKANLVGDVDLVGQEMEDIDFVHHFMEVKPFWKKIDNIHILTPHYLKNDEDLVK